MKFNKRIISILSLVLILSLALVGCGTDDKGGKDVGVDTGKDGGEATLDYPKKPINLIVTWGAGGGTDVTARAFANTSEKYVEESFLVNNVTGGGGAVGWQQAKNAPADGYTLTVLTVDILNHSVKPEETQLSYEDFIPLANMSKYPSVIAVPADSKYNTFEEFIEDAKNNPGEIRLANGGLGKDNHQTALMIEDITGAKFNHVPFDGGAAGIAAALGGNVEGMISNTPEVGGRPDMKMLVQFGPERSQDEPDVPTAKELGYDIEGESFRMIGVSKDTPEEIVNYLEEKFKLTAEDPEWIEFAKKSNASPFYMNREECTKLMDGIFKVKKEIVEKFGL